MTTAMSNRDRAFDQLTSEFPNISVRVMIKIFLSYLERDDSLAEAVENTRRRVKDACLV